MTGHTSAGLAHFFERMIDRHQHFREHTVEGVRLRKYVDGRLDVRPRPDDHVLRKRAAGRERQIAIICAAEGILTGWAGNALQRELMDPLFKEFSASYTRAADFPPEAREEIPEWLHTAIDAGNEAFFAELHEPLPMLYEALTQRAGRIHLLERRFIGMSLSDSGKERKYFCWGLKCADQVVLSSIPVGDRRSGVDADIASEYLACIPAFLSCLYLKMDGMAITPGPTPMGGLDLPADFGMWRPIVDFYESNDLSVEDAEQVIKTLRRDDLRVIVQCANGDLVLCGDHPESQALYLVKDKRQAQVLSGDVRGRLDAFFASAVQGKSARI